MTATATLVHAPGALVEVVLDQCAALGAGLRDGVAPAQHASTMSSMSPALISSTGLSPDA